ncbi:hypothetical protein [Vibrio nigripulchritudo]|uniref:hypothetical protein n=1 Tax=Vibrio nigripulchritudo TaxID=28173 RepID=UPI0011122DA6|nr:hypothetical protein [Vibrio nigripulchritudo]
MKFIGKNTFKHIPTALLVVVALSGCNGGGDSGNTSSNVKPAPKPGGGSVIPDPVKPSNVQKAFTHTTALMNNGMPSKFAISGSKFTHPQPNMGNGAAFRPEVVVSAKPNGGYVVAWRDYSSQTGEGGIVFTEFDDDHNAISNYRFSPELNFGQSYVSRDFRITQAVYGSPLKPMPKRQDVVTDRKGRTWTVQGGVFGGRHQASTLTSRNLHFSGCSLFYHRDDVASAKKALNDLKNKIASESKATILSKQNALYNTFKNQLKTQHAREVYQDYLKELETKSESELKRHYEAEIHQVIQGIESGVVKASDPNRYVEARALQIKGGTWVTYDTEGYVKCEQYYGLFQKRESKSIKGRLSKLVGFTVLDNGNYAFAYSYGIRGMGAAFFNDAPREKTAIRIIQPDGTLVREKVIFGADKPSQHKSRYNSMALSTARMASGDGYIALHTSTQFNYPGQGEHQSGWVGIFDSNLNQLNGDHTTTLSFHNMDHRMIYDASEKQFVALWTSDGGGGLTVGAYKPGKLESSGKPSKETPATSLFKPEQKPASSTTNFTYTQLGQTVGLGDGEYASIFTAALKTKTISSNYNLFFYRGKIDGKPVPDTDLVQYTHFTDAGTGNTGKTMNGTNIVNPKMFPVGENLVVIYQKVLKDRREVDTTYSMVIDKSGKVLQSAAPLIDNNNQPVHIPRGAEPQVLKNGDIVWAVGRTSSAPELNIYAISGNYK